MFWMTARRRRPARVAVLACALALVTSSFAGPAAARPVAGGAAGEAAAAVADPAGLVDPFIGTLGAGFVFPGPQAPFGMVQLSPDTEGNFAYTGYQWADAFIRGFSHVHVQGMGVPEGGNVPFMPVAGPILSTDVMQYQSPFSHAQEEAEPGYYRVLLARYGIDAELTAGERVGMHRYTFPPVPEAHVLLDVGRQVAGGSEGPQRTDGTNRATVKQVDRRTVVGTANTDRAAEDHYAVHFAARFDRDIEGFGVWGSRGAAVDWSKTEVTGSGAGAAVSFDATGDRDVVIKVGISFVDQAGALANLQDELPGDDFGFDALRVRTRAAWNDELKAIQVEGGTPLEQTSFYTALYHVLQHPNLFADADGRYMGYDDQPHRIGDPGDPMPAGTEHYANFSFWDTYRGQVQLLMLVAPDRFRDMVWSLEAIRRWGGRLPRWGLMSEYADFMNGEPALQVFADAYCRGLVPEGAVESLFAEGVRLALKDHRDPSYLKYGYVPYDVSGSGASSTLEHALGDFALALVAEDLGRVPQRAALVRKAANWRNVFDPQTGFVRPRHSNGSWIGNFHPELPDGYREGTGWQYTWLVPHDVAGLFAAIGHTREGMRTVEKRLGTFFSTALTGTVPLITPEIQQKITAFGIAYYGNQYAPSNEHDLHAPYLYAWSPAPWKTQALVRAYQGLYRATPDGLPGNDDLGTMSAWYVWAALGFYPAIAGAPVYVIGSPTFTEARIRLPEGRAFTVKAPGASLVGKYVQSGTLDGAAFSRTWFTHSAIADGGGLVLNMGPAANTSWGTGPGAAPPSMSRSPLAKFGCAPG
jgi:predicted alpha-1,2-mannosidase